MYSGFTPICLRQDKEIPPTCKRRESKKKRTVISELKRQNTYADDLLERS